MTRESTPGSAWLLLGFLTLLNVMNFVDRQLITSFGVPIKRDLRLELWEFGLLNGLMFVFFYTSVGVFLGALADRWSRTRLIAVGLFLWSALTAASGLAENFWQMAAARVLVGVGEATLTPAAISMLSDVFRPRSRALASGVYYLGIPIGAGLSLILSGILEPLVGGWRECFYLLGGLGIPLALATWFLHDPRRGGSEESSIPLVPQPAAAVRRSTIGDIRNCLSPSLVLTICGGVAIHFAMAAALFDPIWIQNEHGFSQERAGIFLGTIFLFGGVTGNVLGGWLGDWFRRRWTAGRLIFLVCGQLLFYPVALNFRWLPADSHWFPVTCFVGAILLTYFYGSLFATVQDLVPVSMRSTIIAVLIFSVNMLGIAPGSIFAGALCDRLVGEVEHPMSWGLFITGLAGLLAVPFFALAAWRYSIDLARVADVKRIPV
jgi:MFS transporter, Spinster family, sphingosine-1-phosphate transporter